jgi:hypothetical protein
MLRAREYRAGGNEMAIGNRKKDRLMMKLKTGDEVTSIGKLPTRWGEVDEVSDMLGNMFYHVKWSDGGQGWYYGDQIAPLVREHKLYHSNPFINKLLIIIYWTIDQLDYYWERRKWQK